ncbi:hypothetical protein C8R47DRAFT_594998 [Mycena vitilis]|nr:hypothetical protein C8R47DRAFT_594998 [Mycena vitilis]
MSSPAAMTPALDFIGDLQIGLVLATWLFGIMTLQTFNYYREFPKDHNVLKGLVTGIWLLEFGHTVSSWHAMYTMTVTFYGQPQHIVNPPISLTFPVFFHGLITIGVQTFFVYRLRVLSGKWLIPIICWTLNLVRLGSLILLSGLLFHDPTITLLTTQYKWEVALSSALGPTVDIIFAGSLVYFLWHRRNPDIPHASRKIVDTIIIWTVETTLLTTITGVIQLILFLTRQDDSTWLIFFLIQAKLFSNSMLASLNGRARFRGTGVLTFGSSTAAQNTEVVIHREQMSDAVSGQEITQSASSDKSDV